MSATNMIKMLESVDANFSVNKPSGKNMYLRVDPGQGYSIDISFANQGEDFFSATVNLDEDGMRQVKVSDSPSSKSDDYSTIVNMVKNAPVKNGYFEEAVSQDGKYKGLLYQDRNCDYGTAFVCLSSTGAFLGVVGF